MIFSWKKELYIGNRPRKTFKSWLIPKTIRDQNRIDDGIKIDVSISLGQKTVTGNFLVNSGGELQIDDKTAKAIRVFSRKNVDVRSISFSASSPPPIQAKFDELTNELPDVPETGTPAKAHSLTEPQFIKVLRSFDLSAFRPFPLSIFVAKSKICIR